MPFTTYELIKESSIVHSFSHSFYFKNVLSSRSLSLLYGNIVQNKCISFCHFCSGILLDHQSSAIRNGMIHDWEAIEELWRHGFHKVGVATEEEAWKVGRGKGLYTRGCRPGGVAERLAPRTHNLMIADSSLIGASNILGQDMNPVDTCNTVCQQCVTPEVDLRE